MNALLPERIDSVRVVELICVELVRGFGTPDDPIRAVRQWWTKDGRKVAEEVQSGGPSQ